MPLLPQLVVWHISGISSEVKTFQKKLPHSSSNHGGLKQTSHKTHFLPNVTIFGKIDHLRASNEIHFLPVQERYIHALSRNTNCLTIDGQVCFYRRLFTDAVKPRGCISWSWGALIGLHGVPNCSSRQSWPPLWIVSVLVTY